MINEEYLRKLQAQYSYERMKTQLLGVPSAQSASFNLNSAQSLYPQSLTSPSFWTQPFLGLAASNSLQGQLLLRAQQIPGGLANLLVPTQNPLLNIALLGNVQSFTPTINALQPQPEIHSILEKVQQLTRPLDSLTTVIEKPIALTPQKDQVETIKKLSKEEKVKTSTTDEASVGGDLEETDSKETEAQDVDKVSLGKKIKKKEMICGHPDRKHYAKGYCSECYHKKSRMQKPKNCPHDNLYARELCQRCYAEKYKKKGKRC